MSPARAGLLTHPAQRGHPAKGPCGDPPGHVPSSGHRGRHQSPLPQRDGGQGEGGTEQRREARGLQLGVRRLNQAEEMKA